MCAHLLFYIFETAGYKRKTERGKGSEALSTNTAFRQSQRVENDKKSDENGV